jgi:biopolymer transport protein ExbD
MVTSTANNGLQVNYPIGLHAVLQPRARREDVIRISGYRDGQIYFRNTRVTGNDLADLITAAVEKGGEKKIYLAADTRVRNRDFELALDQFRIAGITSVAILTN